jgi:DNA N-6-adenine-methyltransferase (Dam)
MQLQLIKPSIDIDFQTDTDQRYTPFSEVEKVRLALGGAIGLDPCSNPDKTITAHHHITESDDCFSTDWEPFLTGPATAFMNPPYSGSAPFIAEWCKYIESGAIHVGITLTLAGLVFNKSTQGLVKKHAKAICFPFGRINFVGGGSSNDRDVVYVLWGKNADVDLFKKHMAGLVTSL